MPKRSKKSIEPAASGEVVIPGVPLAPGDKAQPMGTLSGEEFGRVLARVGEQLAQDNPQLCYRVRYLEAETDAGRKDVLREYIKEFPDPSKRLPWLQERVEENGLQHYVPAAADEKQPWYESSPDVLRRRQIVLKNAHLSAASLCNVFDARSVPLPNSWEEKYNVVSWKDAYKSRGTRPLVQKMIASDKKKG